MFLLDLACQPIEEAFGFGSLYLVGTATERGPHRDVDVRLILDDKRHDKLCKAIGRKGIALLGLTIGQYLASLTGLPIDFQVQRRTEANVLHSGMRNPLGTRSLDNFRGDAQTADMKRMLKQQQNDEHTEEAPTEG
jgi:hypothetical protein